MKLEIQPTAILISPRAEVLFDPQATSTEQRRNSLLDADTDQSLLPYEMEIRPNPEFGYEAALNKLAQLTTIEHDMRTRLLVPTDMPEDDFQPDEFGWTDHRGRLLNISAWLDFDNKVSISCAGAIIHNLQRKRASEFLQDDPDAHFAYRVTSLGMFNCKNSM